MSRTGQPRRSRKQVIGVRGTPRPVAPGQAEQHPHDHKLRALVQISRALSASLDLKAVLEVAIDEAIRVTGAARGNISTVNESAGCFELRALRGYSDEQVLELQSVSLKLTQGLNGRAYRTQHIVICDDVRADSDFVVGTDRAVLSELVIPLVRGGQVIGNIDLHSPRLSAFAEVDLSLLQAMADQAAVAIENARLFEETRRRADELAALNKVAAAVSQSLDLSETLYLALDNTLRVINVEAGAISLVDPAAGELTIRAHRGWRRPDLAERMRIKLGEGLSGQVMRTEAPMITGELVNDPRLAVPDFGQEGVQAMVLAPLRARGKVIGLISAMSYQPHLFTPHDVALLVAMADQVGMAIDNAQLFEATNQRVAELTALQEVSRQLSSSLDVHIVLDLIAQNALKLMRADDVHIFLYDAHKDDFAFGTALWKDGRRQPAVSRPRRDGITARVLHGGQPIVINDAEAHPLFTSPDARGWGLQAIAGFPLRRAEHRLGVITVAFLTPHTFTDDELRVLTVLADQAASALHNARLYQETRRRLDELGALHQVALAATSTLELSAVVERIVRALQNSLNLEHLGLFLLNQTSRTLDLYAHSGTKGDLLRNVRIKLGQGIVGNAAASGLPVRVGDVQTDPRYITGILDIKSEMAVPLIAGEQVIGVIDAQSPRPDAFSADDERVLATAGVQLAVILENARLYELERERRQQMESLQVTAASINAELEGDTLIQLVVDEAARTFKAQAVGLFMWNEDGSHLVVRASHGLSREYVERQRLPKDRVQAAQQGSRLTALVIPNLEQQPFGDLELIKREGLCSALAAPLMSSGILEGTLVIYSKGMARQFSSDEIELALVFGHQAGIAIKNARLYAETRRRLDELTIMSEVALAGAAAGLDLTQVMERMLNAIRRTLRFETFEFILYDPPSGVLHTEASYGLQSDADHPPNFRLGQGVVGWVAQNRQPLLVPDVELEPRYVPTSPRTRSELAVPLTVSDRLVGVMNVENPQVNSFSQDDLRLLQALAGEIAVIIENARLHREMQRRLGEVSTLYSFAQEMSTSLDMSQVLDSIMISLKSLLNCRSVNIWLVTPDGQALEIAAAAGLQDKWKATARLKLGEGIAGQVAATARPMYVPDTHDIDFIFFDSTVRSLLCVPLVTQDRVIGVLGVDKNVPHGFTPDDERLLSIAAAQATVALENARLYRDLHERARNLERAYADMEQADRLKDELVQNVSHELRTPLTFVRGYVEMLLSGDMGPLNPEQRECLSVVSEKASIVARLVADIMLLQQIEHGTLQSADVNLIEVARRAIQIHHVPALAANVTLHEIMPGSVPVIRADRDRLNQVFDNLLTNAIKFSPSGGDVTIQIEDAGTMIRISVSDTGIGMPADQLERIFERFYQVDGSASRRFGGTGLGLAIVKRIVEAHGGRIWATSEMGRGSTFTFELPKPVTI